MKGKEKEKEKEKGSEAAYPHVADVTGRGKGLSLFLAKHTRSSSKNPGIEKTTLSSSSSLFSQVLST